MHRHYRCTLLPLRLCHSFCKGELAISIDYKGRRRLFKLDPNKHVNTSVGQLSHLSVIDRENGSRFLTTTGQKLTVRRPSLEEYAILMPRSATPSYSNNVSAALAMLDVGSGSHVVEAGTGSGAMTLYLSRAGN